MGRNFRFFCQEKKGSEEMKCPWSFKIPDAPKNLTVEQLEIYLLALQANMQMEVKK